MGFTQRLELADHPAVVAEPDLRLDLLFVGDQTKLLQAGRFGRHEHVGGVVTERGPVPEGQRLLEEADRRARILARECAGCLVQEGLELFGIEPTPARHRVPRSGTHEQIPALRPQPTAHPRHVGLERVARLV